MSSAIFTFSDGFEIGKVQRDKSNKSRSLATLTKVLARIMDEEYSPEWKDMSRPDVGTQENGSGAETECPIICDFCGCDVFQSFFECSKCIPSGGAPRGCKGYAICPPCYVEGRSCRCIVMEPMQVSSFNKLIKVQQAAIEVLKACGRKLAPWSPSSQHDSIFRAACLLRDRPKVGFTL
jgi:hypothetical protein